MNGMSQYNGSQNYGRSTNYSYVPIRNNGFIVGGTRRAITEKYSIKVPFKAIEETTDIDSKTFYVGINNLEWFGFESIFSTRHFYNLKIDGVTYKSVDHYYQATKIEHLTGVPPEQLEDLPNTNYGQVSRDMGRKHGISRKTVDQWRVSIGVEVYCKAYLEKARQCKPFLDALIATGLETILLYNMPQDDFYGTGCPAQYVKDWTFSMQKNHIKLKYPNTFPLNPETVQHVPVFAKGRNVLGVILMILREKIIMGFINDLTVPFSDLGQYVQIQFKRERRHHLQERHHPYQQYESQSSAGPSHAHYGSRYTSYVPQHPEHRWQDPRYKPHLDGTYHEMNAIPKYQRASSPEPQPISGMHSGRFINFMPSTSRDYNYGEEEGPMTAHMPPVRTIGSYQHPQNHYEGVHRHYQATQEPMNPMQQRSYNLPHNLTPHVQPVQTQEPPRPIPHQAIQQARAMDLPETKPDIGPASTTTPGDNQPSTSGNQQVIKSGPIPTVVAPTIGAKVKVIRKVVKKPT